MKLAEQLSVLLGDMSQYSEQNFEPMPQYMEKTSLRSATVYSVAEALRQKGQIKDAKLGAGIIRN